MVNFKLQFSTHCITQRCGWKLNCGLTPLTSNICRQVSAGVPRPRRVVWRSASATPAAYCVRSCRSAADGSPAVVSPSRHQVAAPGATHSRSWPIRSWASVIARSRCVSTRSTRPLTSSGCVCASCSTGSIRLVPVPFSSECNVWFNAKVMRRYGLLWFCLVANIMFGLTPKSCVDTVSSCWSFS